MGGRLESPFLGAWSTSPGPEGPLYFPAGPAGVPYALYPTFSVLALGLILS